MFKTIVSHIKCLAVIQSGQSYSCANCLYSRNYSSIKNRKFKEKPLNKNTIVKEYDSKKQASKKGFGSAISQPFHYDPDVLDGEEMDEEVDIYKYHHLEKLEKQDKERYRDKLAMKIIEKKYFKKEQDKVLSWSDREHIRYLHNTDQRTWTYKVLADQFKTDEEVIKAVAKAKWLPKKPKFPEEKFEESSSNFLLNEPAKGSKEIPQQKNKFPSKRKVSFKEFCAESGTTIAIKSPPVKPFPVNENQDNVMPSHEETVLKYITGRGKSNKWAPRNENLKLCVDNDRTGNANVYYYDNQHGYQHPFGKSGSNTDEDGLPLVKEGELYRKGDAFFHEDGEFLFRVPGFSDFKL